MDGTLTKYAYGRNGALTYEARISGESTMASRTYAYLNDQIIGFTEKTSTGIERTCYTVTDITGTVTEVYDSDGNLLWKENYTAFGKASGTETDGFEETFGFSAMFTGCQEDRETGLSYHWNRWRSEDGSSFITQDPARDGGNWYGYCGQNPLTRIDCTGLSTTRDDFAYQKRTETNNFKEYVEANFMEAQAAAENQGRRNSIFCVLNDNCILKTTLTDNWFNHDVKNYYAHIPGIQIPVGFEYKDDVKIEELYKQKTLEQMYGFGNFLCYATSILNIYILEGKVTKSFMDNKFKDILLNNLDSNNNLTADNYSKEIAKALNMKGFYNFVYQPNNGWNQLFLTETAFRLSDYKYGIGRFSKPTNYWRTVLLNVLTKNGIFFNKCKEIQFPTDHYELYRNAPYNDLFNPGIADGKGNYELINIAPMQFIYF